MLKALARVRAGIVMSTGISAPCAESDSTRLQTAGSCRARTPATPSAGLAAQQTAPAPHSASAILHPHPLRAPYLNAPIANGGALEVSTGTPPLAWAPPTFCAGQVALHAHAHPRVSACQGPDELASAPAPAPHAHLHRHSHPHLQAQTLHPHAVPPQPPHCMPPRTHARTRTCTSTRARTPRSTPH
ncbi:hypothetical protein C8R45DRAFT_1103898 [Mycena sanguinolenta]|nr:hypothetical protein C8R45DRAFT_1103898 [Mycena sanguinolenta]